MKLKKIPIFLISTCAIVVSANAETTTDPKKAVHNTIMSSMKNRQ